MKNLIIAASTALLSQATELVGSPAATYANKVCIVNSAGFVMYFNMENLRTG